MPPLSTRYAVMQMSRRMSELIPSPKQECYEAISQSILNPWWLHLSRVPCWLDYPLVEHGQVRPSGLTHGLCRRPLFLFRDDCYSIINRHYLLCICSYRVRFYFPVVPRHRLSASSLVGGSHLCCRGHMLTTCKVLSVRNIDYAYPS